MLDDARLDFIKVTETDDVVNNPIPFDIADDMFNRLHQDSF